MLKKLILVVAVAGAASGAVYGAAATLGGINSYGSLGADNADVISCDTDGVTLSYPQFATPAGYKASGFYLTGLHDDCLGGGASVAIFDGSGALLGQVGGVSVEPDTPNNNKATGFFATPILVEQIEDVAIEVIT